MAVMIDRQGRRRCDSDLYLPGVSSGVHSAGNIDSVPPDIELGFTSTYNASYNWTIVDTCSIERGL